MIQKIPFSPTFKLLGSMLANHLKDDTEVELGVKSAQGAFSQAIPANRKQFFSVRKGINKRSHKTKKNGLRRLNTQHLALYGCETRSQYWSPPKQALNRLRDSFYNHSVRAMRKGLKVARARDSTGPPRPTSSVGCH